MKRPLFIIIGIILVIVLIAVWIYVLFIGTPTSIDEQFANFGFDDTTDTTYQEPVVDTPSEPVVDVATDQRLRQLTTRPVAGYAEVQISSSSPLTMQYMEVGTGHIFSINLDTGEEERISGTTIPGAQKAQFSTNGQYVMVEAGFGASREFVLGHLNRESNSLSNTAIAEPVMSFDRTNDNRFLYAIQTNASVIGKVYDPAALTSETLFTLPFREATFEWGGDVTDAHYVYPKTTNQLESFLYRVKNGVITRMPVDGYGMSAVGNDNYVLYSKLVGEEYNTFYLDISSRKASIAPLVQLPEKCVMTEGRFPITVCANTQYELTSTLPDAWYTGKLLSADNLWEHTPEEGSTRLLVNTQRESGRQLDITNLDISDNGFNIYFTNQSDTTLWVYAKLTNNSDRI